MWVRRHCLKAMLWSVLLTKTRGKNWVCSGLRNQRWQTSTLESQWRNLTCGSNRPVFSLTVWNWGFLEQQCFHGCFRPWEIAVAESLRLTTVIKKKQRAKQDIHKWHESWRNKRYTEEKKTSEKLVCIKLEEGPERWC